MVGNYLEYQGEGFSRAGLIDLLDHVIENFDSSYSISVLRRSISQAGWHPLFKLAENLGDLMGENDNSRGLGLLFYNEVDMDYPFVTLAKMSRIMRRIKTNQGVVSGGMLGRQDLDIPVIGWFDEPTYTESVLEQKVFYQAGVFRIQNDYPKAYYKNRESSLSFAVEKGVMIPSIRASVPLYTHDEHRLRQIILDNWLLNNSYQERQDMLRAITWPGEWEIVVIPEMTIKARA